MRELVMQALMDRLNSGITGEAREAILDTYKLMTDKELLETLLFHERDDAIRYSGF